LHVSHSANSVMDGSNSVDSERDNRREADIATSHEREYMMALLQRLIALEHPLSLNPSAGAGTSPSPSPSPIVNCV
jgi:hypothetical protein